MVNEIKLISAEEVLAKSEADPDLLLLDVRTEEEWEMHHIPGAMLFPMHSVIARLRELDPSRETIVICEHGIRSEQVAYFLAAQANFENVASMVGGMSEWTGPEETGR